MANLLTPNVLRAIYESESQPVPGIPTPVLQVLAVKKINSTTPNSAERWRVVLSDGAFFIQSMLATQLNPMVANNEIVKGGLIKLGQYTMNKMKDKKLLIVLSCQVLAEVGELEKLGSPIAVDEAVAAAPAANTSVQQPATNMYGQGQQAQQPQQVQQSRPSHGNITVYPIEGLSPYQNKWTIRVRVIYKSDVKEWHNQRGQGRLFTVHFLDETGEIRATGFNDQVDAFYDKLKEGNVYFVSKCRVNIAKKQFSNVQNEYELMFERDTVIEPCDETVGLPQARFNFIELGKLNEVEKDATIDVVGVLKDVGEPSEITSKTTQKAVTKRELILVDRSGYSVQMTIWGRQAQEFSAPPESVIAVKGVKVSDFNGRSLSLFSSSMMQIDPDIEEAHALLGWYKNVGRNESFSTHSNIGVRAEGGERKQEERKTLAQVKDEGLGMGETPDYFTSLATVVFIRQENISYPACRSEGCKKKIVEDGSGQWRCERCDKSWDTPLHRYIMTISVNDHTAQAWFNLFDDVGQKVLGVDANTLVEYKDTDTAKANDIFNAANFSMWTWRVRGKQDNFQGQVKVRYQVLDAWPVDYKRESERLVKLIQSY